MVSISAPILRAETDVPAVLEHALVNSSREDNHWAYTETTVVRPKSAKDKEYVKKGEKRAEDLSRGQPGGRGRGGREGSADGRAQLQELIDVEHIAVITETPTAVTYRVPLRKGAKMQSVQVDKIEFEIRIAKEGQTIEHMAMHLKESMRVMLVANVKSADFAMDFTRVDPKYAPVMTRVKGGAKISMLFVARFSPNVDATRKDYERVVPYDDRFQVSIGPLNILK